MRAHVVVALAVLVGILVDCAPQFRGSLSSHYVFSSGIGKRYDPPYQIRARLVPERKVETEKVSTKEPVEPVVQEGPSLADIDESFTLSPVEETTEPIPVMQPDPDPIESAAVPIEQEPQSVIVEQPVAEQVPETEVQPQTHVEEVEAPIQVQDQPARALYIHPLAREELWRRAAYNLAANPELLLWLSGFESQRIAPKQASSVQETAPVQQPIQEPSPIQEPELLPSEPLEETPFVSEPHEIPLEPVDTFVQMPESVHSIVQEPEIHFTEPHHEEIRRQDPIEVEMVQEPEPVMIPQFEHKQQEISQPRIFDTPATEKPSPVEETTIQDLEINADPITEQPDILSPLEEQDMLLVRGKDHFFGRKSSPHKRPVEIQRAKIEKESVRRAQFKKQQLSARRRPNISKIKNLKPSRRVLVKKAKSLINGEQARTKARTQARTQASPIDFNRPAPFRQNVFPTFSYSIRHVPVHPSSSRFFNSG